MGHNKILTQSIQMQSSPEICLPYSFPAVSCHHHSLVTTTKNFLVLHRFLSRHWPLGWPGLSPNHPAPPDHNHPAPSTHPAQLPPSNNPHTQPPSSLPSGEPCWCRLALTLSWGESEAGAKAVVHWPSMTEKCPFRSPHRTTESYHAATGHYSSVFVLLVRHTKKDWTSESERER